VSAAQFAVLVIATLLTVVGGVVALTAEVRDRRRRGVPAAVHLVQVLVPYVGLGVLLWAVWRLV
jgi:hypothetical protein